MNERTIAGITTTAATLNVTFSDGSTVTVPLTCFPRLAHATPRQRAKTQFIGGGIGVHWPLIDEDISVDNILRAHGRCSCRHGTALHPSSDILMAGEPCTPYAAKKRSQTSNRTS